MKIVDIGSRIAVALGKAMHPLVVAGVSLVLAGLGTAADAQAPSWPSRPVRIVVPFPPGGINDVLARVVAQKLSTQLGQSVVVDNRAGASGLVGSGLVAKSPADGYTLVCGSTTTVPVAPSIYKNLTFDPVHDLQPITRIAVVPSLVVVHPSVKVNSIRELIALARAQPGRLNYGSGGPGSIQHLATELFKLRAGIDLVHVPYKGGAPAMADLVGGQLTLMFEAVPTALPNVRAGRTRAIAITSPRRMASLPDIPTVAESGLPGYELAIWLGILAPAGLPEDVLRRLNAELRRVIDDPEVRERFVSQGADPVSDTVEAFSARIASEVTQWAEFARQTDLKVE
jgi:tripartite-type tricarboxylate transporter receptor subunit TctC